MLKICRVGFAGERSIYAENLQFIFVTALTYN